MTDTTQPELHPHLTHYIAWVKAHEKLLVIILGAWLAFHFFGSALTAWVKHDERLANIAQRKVELDATANTQLTQEVADLKQQLAAVLAQTQANMRQRQKETDDQKKHNDNSTSSEVAQRTVLLLHIPQEQVTASTIDQSLTFTSAAAHTNVNALEDGAKAQADVNDLNKQVAACTAVVKKDDELIAGLNTQIADEQKSHKADVALEQAKTKKAWRNGFKWGFVTGIGTAIAVKIAKVF